MHRAGTQGTTTDLYGPLPDEAALMGVLEMLHTHGAHLLALERLDEGAESPKRDRGLGLSDR